MIVTLTSCLKNVCSPSDHWLEVVSSASKMSSVPQLAEEAPLDNSLILLSDMLHYVYIN